MKKIIFSMILFIMLVTQAAATSGFTEPANSVVPSGGDVDIDIYIDIDEPTGCTGGAIEILYDSSCVEAKSYSLASGWVMNSCNSGVDGREFITLLADPAKSGKVLVGTFTFECVCQDCTDTLTFGADSQLNKGEFPFGKIQNIAWIPGSIDCPPQECLGDCYESNDCTGVPFLTDVPCYDCLRNNPTNSWKPTTECPNRDLVCPTGACYTELCPQCCDGIDNDGDGLTDCPDDPGCACCCDYTEEDDPNDPTPCVPELPTIALMSIGVLGMLLLVRKRG